MVVCFGSAFPPAPPEINLRPAWLILTKYSTSRSEVNLVEKSDEPRSEIPLKLLRIVIKASFSF
jgi:hypothetical protein